MCILGWHSGWKIGIAMMAAGIWHLANGGGRAYCPTRAQVPQTGCHIWRGYTALLPQARIPFGRALDGQGTQVPDPAVPGVCSLRFPSFLTVVFSVVPTYQGPLGIGCRGNQVCQETLVELYL